jgi:glycine/D-amino acid oxidase-like deaminating enzyme
VTSEPTEFGHAELLTRLQDVLKIPFEVVEHRACLRPTIKDRRPLVGQHPQHKNLYILNGLGTKGASLAPYLVNELLDFLLENKAIDSDIDLCRYAHLFHESEC